MSVAQNGPTAKAKAMYLSLLFGAALTILASVRVGAAEPDVRLADAAQRRDATTVNALLKHGVNVNTAQPDGGTALHWAAHWNDVAMAQRLLAAGANVNAANDYGVTSLILAATNGSAEMIDALLGGGADPKSALPTGETALMTAVRSGNVMAVQRLLAGGADVNAAQTSKGQTALMWATTDRLVDIAQALLRKGADVRARTKAGFTPLTFAAREGSVAVTRLLLASGADVNTTADDGSTPLLIATVRGHVSLAMLLLQQGAKADGTVAIIGYTPLHWAVARFEQSITKSVLDPPGEWAALSGIPNRAGKLALIEALVAHGADVNARMVKPIPAPDPAVMIVSKVPTGATPFFIAAMGGDAEVMRLLLAHGADSALRAAEDEWTPMMAAILGGNAFTAARVTEQDRINAITVALETGADIEAQDINGYRAMHFAAATEFHGIIKFLLAHGADLNPVSKDRTRMTYGSKQLILGQSPLGLVEGTFRLGFYDERPETAAFLHSLGAKSVGRATFVDTNVKPGSPSATPTASGAK